MTTLTLVSHHLCPYVQRAAIALAEKGVAHERLFISLAEKPAWFTAISPLGKVPLLKVQKPGAAEEVVLFESAPICEYIEETQSGPKLHPADPLDRARHRAWMEFGSAILGDIWGLETTTDAAVFEQKRAAIAQKFERLEEVLGAGPYFAGKNFSLVDAVFGPIFRYFDVFEAYGDLKIFGATPKVRAWRTALKARPSVRDAAVADYPERLRVFLRNHDAYLIKRAA
ncbi:MAG TPA: glutathione S-transferase family protein [Stellaceae bacterium]|nr:glutathione S-transferase family protein [Stellaceae bacterium]